VYRTLTFCGGPFLNPSTTHQLGNSVLGLVPQLSVPTTPTWQRHQALTPRRFRLFPFRSPLLGESLLLSSPQGTEMFQFPWFPLPALCVQAGVTPHDGCRVSPFGHPRINAWSAAPRGFSQPPASFIGARRQGIHRWLFVAWKNKDARARYAILKELVTRGRRRKDAGPRLRGRRCLAQLEGDTPSKQKRGRRAVPSTCGRAEAQSRRLAWRTE
jgi:hypothetical protein